MQFFRCIVISILNYLCLYYFFRDMITINQTLLRLFLIETLRNKGSSDHDCCVLTAIVDCVHLLFFYYMILHLIVVSIFIK